MKRPSLPALTVAVVFGVMVWLSAVMREDYQVTLSAPLSITNLPEGYAIKSPVPRVVRLRVRGEGWVLATMLLGADPRIVYPVLPTGGAEGVFRRVRENYVLTFNDVAERVTLRPGIILVAMQPDSVPVELDRFAQKRVPVVPDIDVSFREGYGQSGPTAVVPESVTVSGAASVLEGITAWKTQRSVFEDVRAPLESDVALIRNDVYDVSTSAGRVRLSIVVEPFAEKVFNGLPVVLSMPPADREVIFIPPKIEVVVRGGIRRLSSVGHEDFRITVPYSTVVADTSGIVEPTISSPPGLQVVSKRPERVQYIVRKSI